MYRSRPNENLLSHLLLVGKLAGLYGGEINSANITEMLGLLHDTGKATAKFQNVLDGNLTLVDHAEVSAQVLYALQERGNISFRDKRILYIMMNILAGHHSRFWDEYADGWFISEKGGIYSLPGSFEHRNVTKDSPKENALSSMDEFENIIKYVTDNCLLRKTDISSGYDLDDMSESARMLYCRMLFSCLVDADYTCAAYASVHTGYNMNDIPDIAFGLSLDRIIEDDKLLKKLNNYHDRLVAGSGTTNPVNVLRNRVYKDAEDAGKSCTPGLYTMTAPTGLGKTLALIKFALEQAKRNRQKRVIVVLPYLSIIQQNAEKYKEIFGKDVVIEADSSVRNDKELKGLADRWDAPVIVTTTVNFFETLMSGRASRLRKLHRIVNSVVVFDESQSLDNKLLSVTMRTLESLGRHFNTTVLLSTATQPSYNDRKDLNADFTEIISDVPGLYSEYGILKNTVTDFVTDGTNFSYYALADRFSDDDEVIYIVNTTKKAWELYLAVSSRHPGDTYLLTGLQAPGDKKRVIQTVQTLLRKRRNNDKEKRPVHLVSTQCIEAGVDIDFLKGCREYSPLTSIIQSAGRINRECKRSGYMLVFSFDDKSGPGQSYINEMGQSLHMAKNVHGALNINDPSVIKAYYKELYGGDPGSDYGYKEPDEYGEDDYVEDTVCYAEHYENMLMMDEKYKVIEDADVSATVIVPSASDIDLYKRLLDKYMNNGYVLNKKDMTEAHDISVNVTGRKRTDFIAEHSMPLTYAGEETGWYIARNDIYDSDTGLKMY